MCVFLFILAAVANACSNSTTTATQGLDGIDSIVVNSEVTLTVNFFESPDSSGSASVTFTGAATADEVFSHEVSGSTWTLNLIASSSQVFYSDAVLFMYTPLAPFMWTVANAQCSAETATLELYLPAGWTMESSSEGGATLSYIGIQASCLALYNAGTRTSGTYTIDPDGSASTFSSMSVYCDMDNDGGGWTLARFGPRVNTGVSIIERSAVGTITSPSQTSAATLSRAAMGAIMTNVEVKYGRSDYGYLYSRDLPLSTVTDGQGQCTGVPNVPHSVSATLTGTTYPGSLFAWPIDGRLAICLNNDGSTGECSYGLHIGCWANPVGDSVYVNYGECCSGDANGYELWIR